MSRSKQKPSKIDNFGPLVDIGVIKRYLVDWKKKKIAIQMVPTQGWSEGVTSIKKREENKRHDPPNPPNLELRKS